MNRPSLVLASQSPRRRELMQLLGLPFEIAAAHISETPRVGETPARLVTRLSRAKAQGAALDAHRNVMVVGCDTVVSLTDEAGGGVRILGKPRSPEHAASMLRQLRGRSHVVYSAVTVLDSAGRATTELAETKLTMRAYTDAELAAYVAGGDPMDKAGAYAIQHEGFHPVENIQGCYASVMGLPLCHLARCLHRLEDELTSELPARCQAHVGHRCAAYEEILVCC